MNDYGKQLGVAQAYQSERRGPLASAIEERREIPTAVQELEKLSSILRDEVNALRQRLEPITRLEPAEACKNGEAPDPSGLLGEISQIARSIRVTTDLVRSQKTLLMV